MAHRFDIEIEDFGQRHAGTYSIRHSLVMVYYGDRRKSTQIGDSRADTIARLLLLEMVRESETVH